MLLSAKIYRSVLFWPPTCSRCWKSRTGVAMEVCYWLSSWADDL